MRKPDTTTVMVAIFDLHEIATGRSVRRGQTFAATDDIVRHFPDSFRVWSPPELETR